MIDHRQFQNSNGKRQTTNEQTEKSKPVQSKFKRGERDRTEVTMGHAGDGRNEN